MKLTKYTHSCVRLEKDGKVLVVDPGGWAEDEALTGADAILITHEHPDHVDADRVRAAGLPIWTTAGVAASLAGNGSDLGEALTVIEGGQSFDAAGFSVRAYGNDHAVILPELGVPCQNVGYLVEDAVYHPGDSWTRPDRKVHTNLVPISGPWYAVPAAIEYTRAVDAEQAVGIHDALLSKVGLGMQASWIGEHGGKPYHPLTPGDSIELD